MENIFGGFYKKTAHILEEKGADYGAETEYAYKGDIMCDVQPYKTGVSDKFKKREYGFSPFCTKKLFCAANELIKTGRITLIDGIYYRIINSEARDMGMTAILEETVL